MLREAGSRPAPDALLSEITRLLLSETAPDRVLEAVGSALRDLVPHDTLTVYEADNPLRVLRPVLVRDTYSDQILAMGALPFGAGLTGSVAESRQAVLLNDAHLDPRASHIPNTPDESESFLAVPLSARDELKGVLCLSRLGPGNYFTNEEFLLTQSFAALAALALDNAHVRARLESEVVTDHLTALGNHRYFHERLREELRVAVKGRGRVGLVIFDVDDFARVNDGYGHVAGDQALQGVASLARELARESDAVCRIGGEEFALVLPGSGLEEASEAAERLREAIAGVSFPEFGGVTVSAGVAEGPLHGSSPRDLTARAHEALRRAKAQGKNRVVAHSSDGAQPVEADMEAPGTQVAGFAAASAERALVTPNGEIRSVAQLRMLQSLSNRLNQLNDVRQIGETITAELRALIDYHNCRVHLLSDDGETLLPVAFRGTLSEYQGETFDALMLKTGVGITGRAVEAGESIYAPDADKCEFAVQIPGTPDIDESILSVPLRYGERTIGAVTISKLGLDQFDHDDLRLLETLASTAAAAFENARLYQQERESAEISRALLELSQAMTTADDTDAVMEKAIDAVPVLLGCTTVGVWLRDADTGEFRLFRHAGFDDRFADLLARHVVDPSVAEEFLLSSQEPFVMSAELVAQVPRELVVLDGPRAVLVSPMRWEPDGFGAIVVAGPDPEWSFSERHLRLARGIADIASLAIGNAERFVELERAYVSTIEALANALEAKDEYTSDHARALAEMAIAVGEDMGLDGDRLKRLELGALFHDIGKIGVPSEIIRKPAALNAAERRLMNLHPEIGEEILAPVPFLQPIRPIVRACHERWDGGGYPDRLQRDNIPLEARIIFVCDAFHAMTTDRPYRNAMPEVEAVRRLELAAGTQFDPDVVASFVKLHREGGIQYTHRH